jgi:hypothetical protein
MDYKDKGRQKILVLDNGEFIRRFPCMCLPAASQGSATMEFYASANKKTKLAMCMVMTKTKEAGSRKGDHGGNR